METNTPPAAPRQELLTIDQLSALIQVPKGTIHRWRVDGKGPRGIKLGGHLRFRMQDVDAWIATAAADVSTRHAS